MCQFQSSKLFISASYDLQNPKYQYIWCYEVCGCLKMGFLPISQKVKGLELSVTVHTNINVPIAILLSYIPTSYDLAS